MNKLVLFDIDGTLIKGFKGHMFAFSKAFLKVYKIKTSIEIINYHGMTDQQIITDVLKKNNLDDKNIKSKLKECMGHFGYIELARPIIHIKFVGLIYDLLRSTCRECSHVLIPKNKIEKCMEDLARAEAEGGLNARRDKVKEIITELRTINQCPYCKAKQKKVSMEKPTTFLEDEKRLSPIELRML